MASMITALAARYNSIAMARPLTTNAVMGFIIAGFGDIACQVWLEGKQSPFSSSSIPASTSTSTSTSTSSSSSSATTIIDDKKTYLPPWDSRRTAEMGLIRAFIMAPFLQVYFPFLSRLVPGTTMPQVFKRVIADQLIGAPVSICLIFATACTLQGKPETTVQRIQEQLIPTWQNGAMYWPFVHSFNFRWVPVTHQPLVAHVASIWWNVVLSYRANAKLGEAGEAGIVNNGSDSPKKDINSNVVVVAVTGTEPKKVF